MDESPLFSDFDSSSKMVTGKRTITSMTTARSKAQRYRKIAKEAVETIGLASKLIDEISRGHETFRLYNADHTKVRTATDGIIELLDELLLNRRSITVDVGIRRFLVNHLPIFETSKGATSLHKTFHNMEIGGMTFAEGVNEEQVVQFVGLLSNAIASNKNRHWMDHKLEGLGVDKISLELPNIEVISKSKRRRQYSETDDQGSSEDQELSLVQSVLTNIEEPSIKSSQKLYQIAVGQIRHMLHSVNQPDQIMAADVARIAKGIATRCRERPNEMVALAISGHFDNYSCLHPVNVAIFSALLAWHILQDPKAPYRIAQIALLYDIGMSRLPRDWTEKDEPLSPDEQEKLKKHTIFSAELLDRQKALDKVNIVVAFEHHIDDRGQGYPLGHAIPDTTLATRIIRISEAMDALIGNAPYRKALSPKSAMQRLLDQWKDTTEGALTARLIRLIGTYPAGSVVTLTSEEIGIVINQAEKQISCPVVRVIVNKKGEIIENGPTVHTGKEVFVSDALPSVKVPFDPLDFFPFK